MDGNIFVETNGQFFPADQWFDLPVGVLGIWCYNIREFLSSGTQDTIHLNFMDGAYEVILSPSSPGKVSVMFWDEASETEIYSGNPEIDFAVFTQTVLKCSNELIELCKTQQCECIVRSLKKNVEALNQAILKYTDPFIGE